MGRRGSLTGYLTIKGIQGHVAYPDLADNAISKSLKVIQDIDNIVWDKGSDNFPPTSLQFAELNAGEASNIIPGELKATFNLRYNDAHNFENIQSRIEDILNLSEVSYTLDWHLSGEPFLTDINSELIQATVKAIKETTNIDTDCSTGGGTSDGRFIAPTGTQVVELGLRNYSIHKINEQVRISEIDELHTLYLKTIENLFAEV